jgi:hypothetical protein
MRADYYPAFYEVYKERFFSSKYGRTYSSVEVLFKGLTEDEAKAKVKEIPHEAGIYVGVQKMVDA